jgi:hypothetical protein
MPVIVHSSTAATRGPESVSKAWERDRAALDEVEQPKHATCLADRHNRDLAETSFPHVHAHAAGTSFHAAVEALGKCKDLRAALHATHVP